MKIEKRYVILLLFFTLGFTGVSEAFDLFESMGKMLGIDGPKTVYWGRLRQLDYETGQIPPTVKALDRKIVRIPGYIVPLEFEKKVVTEFLLVPTLGACIHVPPPPPNQIVYVVMEKGVHVEEIFEPFWVTGQLIISGKNSELAEAGYTMQGLSAELYDGDYPY